MTQTRRKVKIGGAAWTRAVFAAAIRADYDRPSRRNASGARRRAPLALTATGAGAPCYLRPRRWAAAPCALRAVARRAGLATGRCAARGRLRRRARPAFDSPERERDSSPPERRGSPPPVQGRRPLGSGRRASAVLGCRRSALGCRALAGCGRRRRVGRRGRRPRQDRRGAGRRSAWPASALARVVRPRSGLAAGAQRWSRTLRLAARRRLAAATPPRPCGTTARGRSSCCPRPAPGRSRPAWAAC